MEIEISPEPPDDVREALEAALREPRAGEQPESPWWRAGIEENVRGEP